VYRARDTRLGRDVALKVLPAEFAADPDRLRRFEQEARAVAALDHPNILAIHDVGTHEGAPYIVTELLEGESLRDQLKGGALTARKAVEVAVQIAQGLAAAHEKGIVHRDLKPGNVFVTKDGHVKILDFGLAKLAPPRTAEGRARATTVMEATDAWTVLGTVAYMSPEQVRGQAVDQRSDIFAFGGVLYEMLSGKRAFGGDKGADTMSAILTKEPADLSGLDLGVTPSLERLVRRCLEKEASQRFESAHDVMFALEVASAASGPSAVAAGTAPPSRRRVVSFGKDVSVGAPGLNLRSGGMAS
jgi:serine/threonine protein kinase